MDYIEVDWRIEYAISGGCCIYYLVGSITNM